MKTNVSDLRRVNCTVPGTGPWIVEVDTPNRAVNVRHRRSGFLHRVYYGTRTKRVLEDAEIHATALCAVLNALRAKKP